MKSKNKSKTPILKKYAKSLRRMPILNLHYSIYCVINTVLDTLRVQIING